MWMYVEHEEFDTVVNELSSAFDNMSAADILPAIVELTDKAAAGMRLMFEDERSSTPKLDRIKEEVSDLLFDMIVAQLPSGIRPTEAQISKFYNICTDLVVWLINEIAVEYNWIKHTYRYRNVFQGPVSDATIGLSFTILPLGDMAPNVDDQDISQATVRDFVSSVIKL